VKVMGFSWCEKKDIKKFHQIFMGWKFMGFNGPPNFMAMKNPLTGCF